MALTPIGGGSGGGGAVSSVAGRTGAVTLTKSDVGLSNVANTSDANKPLSDAQKGTWLLPTGALAATAPRWAVTSATHSAPTSGRLALYRLWLDAGITVTNISFMAGSTAGATLTHRWFSLYNSSFALLGVTADDTSASWTASTVKTLALASPYVVPTSGNYWLGIVVTGTTMPTFIGNSTTPIGVSNNATPTSAGMSNTGLTDPASAPNPATDPAGSALAGWAWAWVS